jgi:hypothetical protein
MVEKDVFTTINVRTSTRDVLYHLKGPARTYDQMILDLVECYEKGVTNEKN